MMLEEEINNAIGNRIVLFRKSRNLTRKKLANVLEITQQQLEKYEKGLNRISAAKLFIIAKRFNLDMSYFYDNHNYGLENNQKYKRNKEKIDELVSYYLTIKTDKTKMLILELIKELALK